MKRWITGLWMAVATAGMLEFLLVSNPFESAQRMLHSAFGAEGKEVRELLLDPSIQETSHGDRPRRSLDLLGTQWQSNNAARRILFIGNSQMMSVSLANGEEPPSGPETTYTDLVAQHYRGNDMDRAQCYRLAAPAMSYTEALWYVTYLTTVPGLKPDMVVLQLNYQSFWNGSIRDGLLEMLEVPQFSSAVKRIAAAGSSYSEEFADALKRYSARNAKAATSALTWQNSHPADYLDHLIRSRLTDVPGHDRRQHHKSALVDMLYATRIHILRLKPTTARSISGPRLLRSQAALEAALELCRERNVRLVLFNAPVNPRVSLYRTQIDRGSYQQFLRALIERYDVPVYDLEALIPFENWGTWMNMPDPLHLGRTGHRKLADVMIRMIDTEGRRR
jgi:hypothetical protein